MTLAIVQARLGSSRLPQKALLDLHGKPLVQHALERAGEIRGIDKVVLAVPWGDLPHFLNAPFTDSVGEFSVFAPQRVEPNDVLGRFAAVAEAYPAAKTIVRFTGDCPLVEPSVCERVIQLFIATPGCEYAWADTASGAWPDGLDVECFTAASLLWADRAATDPYDREHVTSWIRRHCKVASLPADARYQGWPKVSVDTLDDLALVRGLMERAA